LQTADQSVCISFDSNVHESNTHQSQVDATVLEMGIAPFEFHAFEALLTTVKALETQEFNKLNRAAQDTLAYFKSGSLLLPVKVQECMRYVKNDLSRMLNRVSASRQALQDLTEDDEEMALMNLTVLKFNPSLYK
jgi:chaperonin cofactor prefoldin